jgi:hypothetical protein
LADHLPLRPPERDTVGSEDLRSVVRGVVTLALEKRGGKQLSDFPSSIDAIVDAATQDTR